MNADEARKLSADYSNGTEVANAMNMVFIKIKRAANQGYRATSIETLPYLAKSVVIKNLKELGYKVEESYDVREQTSWITITW
jgi:hypothetical protein